MSDWYLPPDRFLDPEPTTRRVAFELYEAITGLPIVSPHGHVDPCLFVDENTRFGTPSELLILPDHYILRMLYSQGVSFEAMGIPRRDGGAVETDPRKIWQTFADHFYLFRATPSGTWLTHEFKEVLGILQRLTSENAQKIYDQVAEKLASPEFTPRRLFELFKIEVLSTTDPATDSLEAHAAIRKSGWQGRVIPTFRPDLVLNLENENWRADVAALGRTSGIEVRDYGSYLEALRQQRSFFRSMGAVATDHGFRTPRIEPMLEAEAARIFQRALEGNPGSQVAEPFMAHMLFKMAEMSTQDGLVMQIHSGSWRDYSPSIYQAFGHDRGADIPLETHFSRPLQPLLACLGDERRLRLILFTLDETAYARELAPLAGLFPVLRLGPPWWFHDSLNGMRRYFDQVVETAGIYNTVGFNDDTRAFLSIPARHDVWRRASANWLAGLVVRGIVALDEAHAMAYDLAYRLAKEAYGL